METKVRMAVSAVAVVIAVALGGVAAWNQSMENRAMAATPTGETPPPTGGIGTAAPGFGAGLSVLVAIVAQFWKPTDPKQAAIKRQLEALATLLTDGALGQIGPIWKEVTKNGIPTALDARIQWDGKPPYFLRWGQIVEESQGGQTLVESAKRT